MNPVYILSGRRAWRRKIIRIIDRLAIGDSLAWLGLDTVDSKVIYWLFRLLHVTNCDRDLGWLARDRLVLRFIQNTMTLLFHPRNRGTNHRIVCFLCAGNQLLEIVAVASRPCLRIEIFTHDPIGRTGRRKAALDSLPSVQFMQ